VHGDVCAVRAVVRAKCPPEDIIASCEAQDLNASIYDPVKERVATPTKDAPINGYETPLSEVRCPLHVCRDFLSLCEQL
jgi:hypothetical protein